MTIRKSLFVLPFLVCSLVLSPLLQKPAQAAFNRNLLIDDTVFSDTSSMSAAQINAFLNSFPHSCISNNSGFRAKEPTGYSPSTGYSYGAFVTAGQVIWRSAVTYGINPRVLITTLEKEQNLITGRSNFSGYCMASDQNKYTAAMGYGCPDSGTRYSWTNVSLYARNGVERKSTGVTCVNSGLKAGFSQQVIRAAWLLKFGQQRSRGNVDWAVVGGNWNNSDDPGTCYGGPMTQGTFKRCQSGSATFYDGWITVDSTATHMDTGGTAALYWYTPHFHGNQLFVSLFESWFGGTISAGYYSCQNGTNLSSTPSGGRVVMNQYFTTGPKQFSLTLLNNTGSACIEAHTWKPSPQSWISNVATNHVAVNPANDEVITGNTYGDSKDELIFVKYRNTGSGKVEIHTWDRTYQHWISNIATNLPAIDPVDGRIIAANLYGDEHDELVYVKYRNTGSGKVEIHTWNANQQGWLSNVATNLPAETTVDTRVIAANLYGGPGNELVFVAFQNTGSGRIEVHTWNANQQGWLSNVATNHGTVDPVNADVVAGNIYGSPADELSLVKYRNTGSGKVEIHTWNANQQGWLSNIATNVTSFP